MTHRVGATARASFEGPVSSLPWGLGCGCHTTPMPRRSLIMKGKEARGLLAPPSIRKYNAALSAVQNFEFSSGDFGIASPSPPHTRPFPGRRPPAWRCGE